MGQNGEKGTLFLVGTPIGNLKDISLRALETLQNVDLIAAEDTRQTQKLLNYYQIKKPLTSYHEHNQRSKGAWLITELQQGKKIALVSDAGMPGISDPGGDLVQACLAQKIALNVVPGPTALLTAVVASGLDCRRFVFQGFLPRQKKAREKILAELKSEPRTIILYESPHRLLKTLSALENAWGDRFCCLARELTKIHESYQRGTFSELSRYWQDHPVRGELTLVIAGRPPKEKEKITPQEMWAAYHHLRREGLAKKEALRQAAHTLGVPKREVYNLVMRQQNEDSS